MIISSSYWDRNQVMLNEKFEVVRNSRLVLGISVLLIALLSAGLISKEANRTVQVWAAGSNLSPGSFLSDTDIQKVSVLLPDSSKNYISTKAQILGALVISKISAGDLIPVAAVASIDSSINQRFVPITVSTTDCPSDLNRGDIIDIYSVPTRESKFVVEPQLIGSQISVDAVFKEMNLGQISIIGVFSSEQVLPLIQVLSDSRVIIVRSV
jgi:hypothetical protein